MLNILDDGRIDQSRKMSKYRVDVSINEQGLRSLLGSLRKIKGVVSLSTSR